MNERGFRMMEGGLKNTSKKDEHEQAIDRYDEQTKLMSAWVDYPSKEEQEGRLYLYGIVENKGKPEVLLWLKDQNGAELAARRMAQLANEFGGEVVVKRYEKPAPVVPAEKKPDREPTERELKQEALNTYAKEWTCKISQKPEWCIKGKNANGKIQLKHWILPKEGDRFAAERIAKMMNELGESVKVEKVTWDQEGHEEKEEAVEKING